MNDRAELERLQAQVQLTRAGAPGPPGPPSRLSIVSFSAATLSPLVLQAVTSGSHFVQAVVVVVSPFDGSISVGTTADPEEVLSTNAVAGATVGQYGTDEIAVFPSDDLLIVTLTGNTHGAGYIAYSVQ